MLSNGGVDNPGYDDEKEPNEKETDEDQSRNLSDDAEDPPQKAKQEKDDENPVGTTSIDAKDHELKNEVTPAFTRYKIAKQLLLVSIWICMVSSIPFS
jgi:hypothetical protein